jgi:tetratricopeptide (TPR) repeat protein
MTRSCRRIGVLALLGAAAVFSGGLRALAQAQEQTQGQQVPYTLAEYNAYQAAAKETNPQQKVKLLDDFVAKFPNSALLPYVYRTYYTTYNQLKDYPKVIEYADKLLALGNKIDPGTQLEAVYEREVAFNYSFNEKAANAADQARSALAAGQKGLELLAGLKKPANLTDEQFAEQKKGPEALFNYTAGRCSLVLKDYKSAVTSFQAALQDNPKDSISYYFLGLAYLQQSPPDSMDGFWALARAIALKGPSEPQVRSYLRQQLLVYQQPGCDSLLDDQMNQLLQLASTSTTVDRPANFTIPSVADLNAIRQKSTILSVITDLQAGGAQAKGTWLAICGTEFQKVAGKVIDVSAQPSAVVLDVNTAVTAAGYDQEAMQKATTANMQVKVEDQPEASRLHKDDWIEFTGTLVSYDTQPFMLHWDKARITGGIPPPQPERKRPHHRTRR